MAYQFDEKEENIQSLKNINEGEAESVQQQQRLPKTNSTLTKLLLGESVEQQPQLKTKASQIWNNLQSSNNTPLAIKYNLFWPNPKEDGKIYEIKLELPGDLKVEDCILISIREFNKILESKGQTFKLPSNTTFFELHFAKKSGLPKDDYPALDPNQILSQTKVLSLCLIYTTIEPTEKEVPKEEQKQRQISYDKSLKDFKRNTSASSQDEMIPSSTFCFCFSLKKSNKKVTK